MPNLVVNLEAAGLCQVFKERYPAQLGLGLVAWLTMSREEAGSPAEVLLCLESQSGERIAERTMKLAYPFPDKSPLETNTIPLGWNLAEVKIVSPGVYRALVSVNGKTLAASPLVALQK